VKKRGRKKGAHAVLEKRKIYKPDFGTSFSPLEKKGFRD